MIRSQIYSAAWRAAVALLSVEIAVVSVLRYFTSIEPPPPPILANAFAQPFLIIHVVGGVTALLVGPLQFVRLIRDRWPSFHRATGRIYVAACAIGAPSGFVLAMGTTAGPVVTVGFAIPAVLCAAFTWLGWRAAVERRFDAHAEWMLRSYGVIAVAITLRLLIPAAAFLDFDFLSAYRVNSWLAWIINVALVEYVIRRKRGFSATYGRLARA
ncbi:MAG: DUF2306 domain-containing protein [Pseudomonadota bacterium]|nr:DUF2306 domain-containing protein [Pseudomonadota bacterium]